MSQAIAFLKGHGTGNDFVIVPDLQGQLELSAQWVAAVCDRHTGIGADGVLRVVAQGDRYFMDYRNSDGSLAETCGNGLRVFARYLVEAGLRTTGEFIVGTRGGDVTIRIRPDDQHFDDIAVDMGVPIGEDEPTTHVTTEVGHFTGTPVWIPNPHCVAIMGFGEEAGSLRDAPALDPAATFPHGANVEFVEPVSQNHIRMRTFERGVGETMACGSGACAAAHVWATRQGLTGQWTVRVDVLGGTLFVDRHATGHVTLRGPARIVAQGHTWM